MYYEGNGVVLILLFMKDRYITPKKYAIHRPCHFFRSHCKKAATKSSSQTATRCCNANSRCFLEECRSTRKRIVGAAGTESFPKGRKRIKRPPVIHLFFIASTPYTRIACQTTTRTRPKALPSAQCAIRTNRIYFHTSILPGLRKTRALNLYNALRNSSRN